MKPPDAAACTNSKLNILAKELQVGPFEHHRASEDAAVLGRIYVKLLKRLREEMHAVTTADINPVLATTDRKNKLKKPAALSFYHSGEEPGGTAQPVSADFQELSGILQQAPHYAAQRTHPSP